MEKKKHSLDIFEVLKQLDRKNFEVYENLTEEERKSFSPLVIMRWMSGISDQRQVYFLNTIVNPLVYNLGDHRGLLAKLLSVTTDGKVKRYQWQAMKSKKNSHKYSLKVITEFYGYSMREANKVKHLISKDDLIEMAENLGWTKNDIKELKKE